MLAKILILKNLKRKIFTRPSPPSIINIAQRGRKSSGAPDFIATIAKNTPIVLEPASPIRRILGLALNQRYAISAVINKMTNEANSVPLST